VSAYGDSTVVFVGGGELDVEFYGSVNIVRGARRGGRSWLGFVTRDTELQLHRDRCAVGGARPR
jgi:hypothetical protein